MLIVQFTNILIFDYTYFIYRHLLMTYIKYLWKEKVTWQCTVHCHSLFQRTDNLRYRGTTVIVKPLVYTVAHLYRHRWIHEIGRTYLYRRGTGHDKLYRISGVADASKTYYRNIYGFRHLPHHAQGDRLHGRSAQSAGTDAQTGATPLYVYRHSH